MASNTVNGAVLHRRQYDLPIFIDSELDAESTDDDEQLKDDFDDQ